MQNKIASLYPHARVRHCFPVVYLRKKTLKSPQIDADLSYNVRTFSGPKSLIDGTRSPDGRPVDAPIEEQHHEHGNEE